MKNPGLIVSKIIEKWKTVDNPTTSPQGCTMEKASYSKKKKKKSVLAWLRVTKLTKLITTKHLTQLSSTAVKR